MVSETTPSQLHDVVSNRITVKTVNIFFMTIPSINGKLWWPAKSTGWSLTVAVSAHSTKTALALFHLALDTLSAATMFPLYLSSLP